MKREQKRKLLEKNYYKHHPCNDVFTCKVCGWKVGPAGAGSEHRNHCPNCLHSLHLDVEPGDRAADCGGILEPIGVWGSCPPCWAAEDRNCNGRKSRGRICPLDFLIFPCGQTGPDGV